MPKEHNFLYFITEKFNLQHSLVDTGQNYLFKGCTVWFYSPKAEAFDFRHYSKKSYPATCYEGFPYVGASAYGIGVTSECSAKFTENFAQTKELYEFAAAVQKPTVYVGEPSYYHDKKAFGYWSLPSKETEV